MDAANYPLPADTSDETPIPPLHLLAASVASLSATVEGHQQELAKLEAAMREVIHRLNALSVAPPAPPPAPVQPTMPTHPVSAIKLPEPYDGEPNGCEGFLLQCDLFLSHYPQMPDASKVAAVITHLKGKALEWATAVWRGGEVTTSFNQFTALFRAVFDHPTDGKERSEKLLRLSQGTGTAAEYALQFRTLAAASGWNEQALTAVYRRGLREDVRGELACRDQNLTLDALIDLSINLDYLLQERRRHRRTSPLPFCHSESESEPMQVGSAHLTPQERRRRVEQGLCLYCGDHSHQVELCPKRPQPRVRRPQPANPHKGTLTLTDKL
ncbi:hypothetical protein ACEWY4_017050 [Coilia grayii]|uniref:Retrotransposon gag domain-containing protein n=1 Tax=Coilia grayii TaxID=363190 RepID=A0ABD1JM82_9TELE